MPEAKRKTNAKKNVKATSKKPIERKTNNSRKDENITSSNDNSLSSKVKKVVSSYAFLYSAFSVLLISVAILGGMVYVKGKEVKKNRSNIVIPILEDGNRSSLNIDLAELREVGEYVIKVTNYRGDKVNADEFDYSITVRNESLADIKVTKDDGKDNLIVDKEATIIEGVGFGNSKKEEDIYHITVSDKTKIKKKSVINLEIVTQKKSS